MSRRERSRAQLDEWDAVLGRGESVEIGYVRWKLLLVLLVLLVSVGAVVLGGAMARLADGTGQRLLGAGLCLSCLLGTAVFVRALSGGPALVMVTDGLQVTPRGVARERLDVPWRTVRDAGVLRLRGMQILHLTVEDERGRSRSRTLPWPLAVVRADDVAAWLRERAHLRRAR